MKLRNTIVRSMVILCILGLSLGIGFVYQTVWHKIDLNSHPREYAEYVSRYAGEYGVPEYIVYAVIKTESDFESNKLSDAGEIGLMQISPATFNWLLTLTKETMEPGILYDPETNIRYGTYMLSYLYTEYSRWNTVFAILEAGQDAVDAWMNDRSLVDALGNLEKIPDDNVEDYVEQINETLEVYRNLYYTAASQP